MGKPVEPGPEERNPSKRIEPIEAKKDNESKIVVSKENKIAKWPGPKENVLKLYQETPSNVQQVNKKFPIKKAIADESGFDRFKNTLSKGWNQFRMWMDEHMSWLKPIARVVSNFVPFGPVIEQALEKAVDIGDKLSDLNGVKKGSFSLYDIMFIYRNAIVALLFKLAIDNQVPVDTAEFKKLFHTMPEFKSYLNGGQGGEFVKTITEAVGSAEKVITDNDPSKVPHNRKQVQAQASALIRKHEQSKTPEGQPMVVGKKDMYKWLT